MKPTTAAMKSVVIVSALALLGGCAANAAKDDPASNRPASMSPHTQGEMPMSQMNPPSDDNKNRSMAQMQPMQERMNKIHETMHQMQSAKTPSEREQLRQQQMRLMQENMQMMRPMMMSMMMGGGMRGGTMDGNMMSGNSGMPCAPMGSTRKQARDKTAHDGMDMKNDSAAQVGQ